MCALPQGEDDPWASGGYLGVLQLSEPAAIDPVRT